MYTVAYAAFAIAHLVIGIWGLRLYLRHRTVAGLTLILPIFALVYDNAVAAAGSLVGEGTTLLALTSPRFVGHAFLTPIWIVSSTGLAALVGVALAQRCAITIAAWVLYAGMAALGVIDALLLLDLVPLREGSVLVYTNAGGLPGPPAPAVVMVLVTLAWSVPVLRVARWPWMLVGALVMLVAAAIPAEVAGFVLSAAGEVVLAAALVATEARALRGLAPADLPVAPARA
jgi:hypothetical protein